MINATIRERRFERRLQTCVVETFPYFHMTNIKSFKNNILFSFSGFRDSRGMTSKKKRKEKEEEKEGFYFQKGVRLHPPPPPLDGPDKHNFFGLVTDFYVSDSHAINAKRNFNSIVTFVMRITDQPCIDSCLTEIINKTFC